MRLTVTAGNLLEAIKGAGVPKRSTLPVLEFALVAPDGHGAVRITSSDTETQCSVRMECDYLGDGQFLLPSQKTAAWTALQTKDAEVAVTASSGIVTLACGTSRIRLPSLDAADYPIFNAMPPLQTISLQADEFSAMLNSVSFAAAAAMNDVRYYLHGVLLEIGHGWLTAVATDGHRLAKAEIRMPCAASGLLHAIVPLSAVNRLRAMGDGAVDLSLLSSEPTAQPSLLSVNYQSTGASVITKLIDGQYPDYRRAIPTDVVGVATVSRESIISSVRRAMVCANAQHHGVRFTRSENGADDVAMATYSVTGEAGGEEAESAFEFERSGDPPPIIGINGQYLLDALSAAGDCVTLSFCGVDGLRPMTVTSSSIDGWLCVISPMRL